MTTAITLSTPAGHRWKHWTLAAAMTMASALAWALPAPSEIESAVTAGHYTQAETMLREVLKEKPLSAKAHYELGQVLAREGRVVEARGELQQAQRLDSSLKFASSPQHFRDMLAKLDSATEAPTPVNGGVRANIGSGSVALPAPRPEPPAPSFPWGMVLGGGALVVIVMMLMRRKPAVNMTAPGGMATATAGGAPMGAGYGYGQPGYPAPNTGSGIGGAVLGGVAGMAAGYGLAKVLEHHDDAPTGHAGYSGQTSVPFDNATSAPDLGNFDAGSGGGWDDGGGSSGGGDDNW